MVDIKTKKALLWIFGILGGLLLVVVICAAILLAMMPMRIHMPSTKQICGTNAKAIVNALLIYAFDYDDKYPIENWCDLLIMECDVGPKSFLCPESDCVKGESSYALNLAAAEWGTTAPPDMVVAFETSAGRKGQREVLETKKKFQSFILKDMKIGEVYKDRWNQIGGPELLTLENHNGEGANFLFGDGHARFVRAHRLTELQWNKDDTVKLTEADVQRLVKEAQEAKK